MSRYDILCGRSRPSNLIDIIKGSRLKEGTPIVTVKGQQGWISKNGNFSPDFNNLKYALGVWEKFYVYNNTDGRPEVISLIVENCDTCNKSCTKNPSSKSNDYEECSYENQLINWEFNDDLLKKMNNEELVSFYKSL